MNTRFKSPSKRRMNKTSRSDRQIFKNNKREKFKHYDLFTYKSQTKNSNLKLKVAPKSLIQSGFDSPDKTEILENISCSEKDFKIDQK